MTDSEKIDEMVDSLPDFFVESRKIAKKSPYLKKELISVASVELKSRTKTIVLSSEHVDAIPLV